MTKRCMWSISIFQHILVTRILLASSRSGGGMSGHNQASGQHGGVLNPSQVQDPARLTDEQRLLMLLAQDYDRYTRPVFNSSHSVEVKIGITLNQIFDIDERNMVLTTHIWLDQEWFDEKLTWEPVEYNNLTTLRVPCHLIWKPDIVLYNSADDYTQGYMQALTMVDYTGHVFWPPIVKFRSTCRIDITYFPFDDQTCMLKLGSWAYDGLQVDVLKRTNAIDIDNYVDNGEWELIDVRVDRNVVYYSCCPEPYPDVTFLLHVRRRTLYYTYNVVIPCLMLSCLTLLEFWMPPEGGEKVALGLTILLAYSVFMLLIAENMPTTSFNIPLIGVYIITIMGLSSMSVMFAVIASNMHHQSFMDRQAPRWLVSMTRHLGPYVHVRPRVGSLRNIHKSALDCAPQETTVYVNLESQQDWKSQNACGTPTTLVSPSPSNMKSQRLRESLSNFSIALSNGQSNPESVKLVTYSSKSRNNERQPSIIVRKKSKNKKGESSNTAEGRVSRRVSRVGKRLARDDASGTQPPLKCESNCKEDSTEPQDVTASDPPTHACNSALCSCISKDDVYQIIKRLETIVMLQKDLLEPENRDKNNKEWQEVAEVMDRVMFWLYMILTICATVGILVLFPLGKDAQL